MAPLLRFLRRSVTLWVGTIFVVAGTSAAIGAALEWRDLHRFEREAVSAQATVVATSLERAAADGNTRTRYLVTYRVDGPSGPPIELTEELPVDEWERLAAGSVVGVRYLPGDPRSLRVRDARPAWTSALVVLVTATCALLGALLARREWRRALVVLRVQRHGIGAEGKVLEVAPAGVNVNRVPQWHVRYEYRDRLGRTWTAVSDLLAPHEAQQWHAGDVGAVRYDRDRPSDSVWLGKG